MDEKFRILVNPFGDDYRAVICDGKAVGLSATGATPVDALRNLATKYQDYFAWLQRREKDKAAYGPPHE